MKSYHFSIYLLEVTFLHKLKLTSSEYKGICLDNIITPNYKGFLVTSAEFKTTYLLGSNFTFGLNILNFP